MGDSEKIKGYRVKTVGEKKNVKNLMHQSLVTTAPTPGAGDNRGNERGFDLQIIPGRAREQPGLCPIYAKTAVQ